MSGPDPTTASAVQGARGRDRSWVESRQAVLQRDGNRCQSCGQPCRADEADVHHLVPRAAGGDDDPANLITLCDGCHAARHPNLQGSLARRMIERWGLRLARWLDWQRQIPELDETLGAALRLLGVQSFRHPQLDVVLAALRGESVLLVSATGSGKSLCFQLPTLLQRGTGVVISPLKALMSQQVSSLTGKQIPATFINSDLDPAEKGIRYELLGKGVFKFLFCTPERFDPAMVRPEEIEKVTRVKSSYLIVDEAHCIDRWGSDFRPNYGRLGEVRRRLGNPPVLAFTATAGVESQKRILQSLGIPDARVIVTGANRPNIGLARLSVADDGERAKLIDRLLGMATGHAMIFVPTVKVGLHVQALLRKLGRDVPFYHSRHGTANERDMLLGRFTGRLDPPLPAVICTNAFGMGLDVPDVRLVVHWQHPASLEDYLQEFGRAGRDGEPAVAILFTGPRDESLQRFMAEKTVQAAEIPGHLKEGALQAKYGGILEMNRAANERGRCFRKGIVNYFGERRREERVGVAVRIVRWLFERQARALQRNFCCDACDRVDSRAVVRWADRVLLERRRRIE